ncbi:4Fe-4S dicluster domain-containing protein [Novispirillum sp. DQ9]|uniref:4Fe-4S dicluster domain-containing protein n=1 Tax=Novispirillum sp. DQ9 TaxID=3398612 RepID=UPI003C7B0476
MTVASGILPFADLAALFAALAARGMEVVGPTVREEAITLAPLSGPEDLPAGWTDVQAPGAYRLTRRDDGALFGHTTPAQGWKRYLHPPEVRLFRAAVSADGFTITDGPPPAPRRAFLGVRACDLMAIALLDTALRDDPIHAARRRGALLIAVTCAQAGPMCFCASMGSGPKPVAPHDVALTEILDGGHRFLLEAASPEGAALLADLPLAPTGAGDIAARDRQLAAAAVQERALPAGTPERLGRVLDHPHWTAVAQRCLTCGNCTMACPTCFCATVEDSSSLDGATAERHRLWDSCFSLDFSYIHGGSVRESGASRYRQWMTHKLSSWFDQFGTSGCVGCGRCITWCPVGIDITEEAATFAALERAAQVAEET